MLDYILKQDALNAIKFAELGKEYEAVERIPVVNIENRKIGKWVAFIASNSLYENARMMMCSNCKTVALSVTPHCPWCGSENI